MTTVLTNTMEPAAKGTLITEEAASVGVKAVAAKDGITAINIRSSRMLLAYLQEREEAARAHLHDYLGQLGGGIRETWLERGFSEDLLPDIQRLSLPATAQTQDIVQQVCRQEEKLIGELGHLARECPTEETAALLSALSSLEQTRLTRQGDEGNWSWQGGAYQLFRITAWCAFKTTGKAIRVSG